MDVQRSADFYKKVIGWNIRHRDDGNIAFDDAVGEVSGTWILGRPPESNPSLTVWIMVDDAVATLQSIAANGGKVVQAIGPDLPEITAKFSDPAGNVLGLYQQPA